MTTRFHPLADVQSPHICPDTRIWRFVVVLPEARIGADCNISSYALIENYVVIGDCVTVRFCVHLGDGLRIEDDVFIGQNVIFTNASFPRSKQYPHAFPITTVKTGSSIWDAGDHAARHNDRPTRDDRCGRGGDRDHFRWCSGGRQLGVNRLLRGRRP